MYSYYLLFLLFSNAINEPLQLSPANIALLRLEGSNNTIDNTAPIIGNNIKSRRT